MAVAAVDPSDLTGALVAAFGCGCVTKEKTSSVKREILSYPTLFGIQYGKFLGLIQSNRHFSNSELSISISEILQRETEEEKSIEFDFLVFLWSNRIRYRYFLEHLFADTDSSWRRKKLWF